MASESVPGALLSSYIDDALAMLDSDDVLNYFQDKDLDENLLDKLSDSLLSIKLVMDDAENKHFSNNNKQVSKWLYKVRDVVHDAEDLLDEIPTQASNKVTSSYLASSLVSSFDKELQSRMKDILHNLELLARKIVILGLKEGSGVGHGSEKRTSQRLETTSLVDETTVCGRDDDKKVIIDLLFSDNYNGSGGNNLTVISIVGMGGMGKTTLAQLVFNDKSMDDEFQLKAWVCVSEDFDIVKVTRTILKELSLPTDDSESLNLLQVKLREKLTGKKFLLVLDDVWEDEFLKWEALRSPLLSGARGSKILVTTRSEKVALTMRCAYLHQLKQLSHEQSWWLFTKYAQLDANSTSDFEEIGRKIVKNCDGLPLALKAIGSLLHAKSSYEEWNGILTSEIWDILDDGYGIIPALRLSYRYLPSPLKRCFAYCSLIPKGHEFDKDWLVELWMAENFLQVHRQNRSMKELGDQFFNDLLLRSFFQRSSSEGGLFVMHDLVNDLATYVSREFYLRLEDEEAKNVSKMTRHVSFLQNCGEGSKQFEAIIKANKLRTFLPFNYQSMSSKMVHDLLSKCRRLRALSLDLSIMVHELPVFIGYTKHLRYLKLSIYSMKKLPNSICLLYNLQTLKLANCHDLEELPSNMQELVNLRHLDLTGTKVRVLPNGIGNLTKLEALSSFYVGKCGESNLNKLGELKLLRGTLSIEELQNVVDPMDALAANLKNKIHLKGLKLEWSTNDDGSEHEKDVLEMLQPPPNLKHLSMIKYGGTRFPDWIGDMCNNIVQLELRDCKYCLSLPPLGMLASLKMLIIEGLEAMKSIGAEFYGNSNSSSSCADAAPFRSLQILRFENMKGWEEWDCENASSSSSSSSSGITGAAFPFLQELSILKCPLLKNKLPQRLPSLLKLRIRDCEQLVASIACASAIHEVELYRCGNVRLEFPVSSSLETIKFWNSPDLEFEIQQGYPLFNFLRSLVSLNSCRTLKALPLDLFPKLRTLTLNGCSNLERVDVESGGIAYLERLDIVRCPKLVSIPFILFPSLTRLVLRSCPEVEWPEEKGGFGGFPSSLELLEIYKCPKLIASQNKWGLHACTSLTHLSVEHSFFQCVDYKGLLPPNLDSLNGKAVGPV